MFWLIDFETAWYKPNDTRMINKIITTLNFLCDDIKFLKKTNRDPKKANKNPMIVDNPDVKTNPDVPGSMYPAKNIPKISLFRCGSLHVIHIQSLNSLYVIMGTLASRK